MKKLYSTHVNTKIRKRQIILAALACFTENGFTETSIADICQKSGASTGSVYHHFKSKGKLAAAIYLEGIRDYQTGMVTTLTKQENARDGIFAITRYHLSWVKKNPEWARFLFQKRHAEYMDDSEKEMKSLNDAFSRDMSTWFQAHIRAGNIRSLPRDVIIALLLGPCQEFSRLYVSGFTRTDMSKAADALAESAWASLGIDAHQKGGKNESTGNT